MFNSGRKVFVIFQCWIEQLSLHGGISCIHTTINSTDICHPHTYNMSDSFTWIACLQQIPVPSAHYTSSCALPSDHPAHVLINLPKHSGLGDKICLPLTTVGPMESTKTCYTVFTKPKPKKQTCLHQWMPNNNFHQYPQCYPTVLSGSDRTSMTNSKTWNTCWKSQIW
jgi:hypothetical protein